MKREKSRPGLQVWGWGQTFGRKIVRTIEEREPSRGNYEARRLGSRKMGKKILFLSEAHGGETWDLWPEVGGESRKGSKEALNS